MTDVHTRRQRSFNMSRIRAKDTRPEMIVRSLVHQMGYRFRLHRRDLPGTPDLVLPRHHKVIFVHGCFWHQHRCRYGRVTPKTNAAFWAAKRQGNVTRDRRNLRQLRAAGWDVLVIWECWTRFPEEKVIPRLDAFLNSPDRQV
ncbi:MAG: very short patch repair endonuclease [Fuerstiella sp.]